MKQYETIKLNKRGGTEVFLEICKAELVLKGQGRNNKGKGKRKRHSKGRNSKDLEVETYYHLGN